MNFKEMDSQKLGYSEGWLSIFVNIILFFVKYWAGIVTGSIALIADAWHTLSDSISSIILIIGVKFSGKLPDRDHPFGHGRAENIAAIIIAILLSIIALNFVKESVEKLINRESVVFGTFAITATIISIVGKEGLAQFAFWASRKSNSRILRADGWHHRSDAISSIIILVGILFGQYFWWIDGILGLLVAVLIFYAAYDIFKESVHPLLGSKLDENLINLVNEICIEERGENIKAHHFHIHKYGNHSELTFHIKFPADETIEKAHNVTNKIESRIREKLGIESTIHMEPDTNYK